MRATLACLLAMAACFMFSADASYAKGYHRTSYYRKPSKTVVSLQGARGGAFSSGGGAFAAGGGAFAAGGGAFAAGGGGGAFLSGGAGFLSAVEIGVAIQSLRDDLKEVAKRGCLTGNVQVVICDANNYDAAYCTYKYEGNDAFEKIVEILVDYDDDDDDDFDDLPVVTAGLAGISGAASKDCEVEATYVTKKGFKLRLTLGGVLPFELNLFWMACDERDD